MEKFQPIIEKPVSELESAPEGWKTASKVSEEVGSAHTTIKNFTDNYRTSNPEWFKMYIDGINRVREHFSPELIELFVSEKLKFENAPEGWKTLGAITKDTGSGGSTIRKAVDTYRASNPEWFKVYVTENGLLREHLSPDLIELFRSKQSEFENAPEGWKTVKTIVDEVGSTHKTIKKFADRYRVSNPEWFKVYVGENNVAYEFLSPELIELFRSKQSEFENAPEGWKTIGRVVKETGTSSGTIKNFTDNYRTSNPEWFKMYMEGSNKPREHLSPNLIELFRSKQSEFENAPEGWKTINWIAKELGRGRSTIKILVDKYRTSNPEWFKIYMEGSNKPREHLSPDLIELFRSKQSEFENAPEGWKTIGRVAKENGVGYGTVKEIIDEYRNSNPGWFKMYIGERNIAYEFLSPELVLKIKGKFTKETKDKGGIRDFEKFFLDKETSEEVKHLKELIGLFGSSGAIDILYAMHPEFKAVPINRVRSVIAEYLGNYLLSPGIFSIESIEHNLSYIKEGNMRAGLVEVIKDHCLKNFLKEKKSNPSMADESVFQLYFDDLRGRANNYLNSDLESVIEEVSAYYQSILNFPKGKNLVESVNPGRSFPDIYQRINIKEISDKNRLLIADEMGVGKSASTIIAKESLGSKLALVVVPSNVVDTWKNYLSDKVGEDGKQIGYFKPGEQPRILIVENISDIENINSGDYDYILISQERLSDKYSEALEKIDYDMLIVDEIHRFKNITGGIRSEKLIQLTKKIEGDDKYLALLSGTPVPNKINDVALLLRLLHPEQFKDIDNDKITSSILKGNLSDIRALLVPYMQRKDLRDHIEMPNLEEETIDVSLSQMEADIYQVLLEEDELTATEKMILLRRFLLNHQALDVTPNIPSSKINTLKENLSKTFETKDKVVLFVNDYVNGVIHGENSILSGLQLPNDVEIKVVHGQVSQEDRVSIQREFNTPNGKKMLLVVSGQTAGVGVDYTGGEQMYFYNEPWTKADADQQKARVYRPGLKHDVKSETLITKNTIEEGIHRYIELKHQAVNKLLNGIPITEFEIELLERSEKAGDDLEVDSELADYYFSSFDKMNKIFAAVKEMGEKNFWDFIEKHGVEYADCYFELGNRSYQANASRVCATLIESMIKERGQNSKELQIIDIASGPEMLRRHSKEDVQPAIVSMDININHFIARGTKNAIIGSYTDIPFPDNNFDYANFSLALHYSKFLPSKGEYERAKVLTEINRVLKKGGRAVINMIYSLDFKDEEKFRDIAGLFGLKVVGEYSGEVSVADNYKSKVITLEKSGDVRRPAEEEMEGLTREQMEGLKFFRTETGIRDSRKILSEFSLNDKTFQINFNAEDKVIMEEERIVLEGGRNLKEKYGSIEEIPKDQVLENNFVRLLIGKKYILFRKLSQGGVVLIK